MEEIGHWESFESYIPLDLWSGAGFLASFMVILGLVLARYFAVVGLFYLLFWKSRILRNHVDYLHDRRTGKDQLRFEVKWSVYSSFVFSIVGYVMGLLWQQGYTAIYIEFDRFHWLYLPVSFILYTLLHEIYFYGTHVWMHRPWVFRRIHSIHHYSMVTTPWASFSFHPLEAVVHAAFLPLAVCLLPVHPVVLLAYLVLMTVAAMSNHLGVEILPRFLQKWLISGTHHHLHHEKFQGNFGLYFRLADQLMGTELWRSHEEGDCDRFRLRRSRRSCETDQKRM